MDKTAYLDAMNITRWRSASAPQKPYLIIHDIDADLSADAFMNEILSLLSISPDDCEFDCDMVKGPQVIWDMRKVKMRPRVAWLVSAPLDVLISSADEKRLLWQQICAHLDKAVA